MSQYDIGGGCDKLNGDYGALKITQFRRLIEGTSRFARPAKAERPPGRISHRIAVLDSFRALAIVAVIQYHYTMSWVPVQGVSVAHFVARPSQHFGWLGVEFFFMISGFVIFLTLHNCTSIWEFALRRFIRLFPTLLFAALATFILAPMIHGHTQPVEMRAIIPSVFLISGNNRFPWVDAAYWSLQVEAIFYAWIGSLFFVLRKRFLLSWLILVALSTTLPVIHPAYGFLIPCAPYISFFTFGMACYLRFKEKRTTVESGALLVASVISYIMLWHAQPPTAHVAIIAMIISFEAFLRGWLGWLAHPSIIFIGQISYPLYLLHNSLGLSMLSRIYGDGGTNHAIAIAAVFILMIGASTVMHYLIERPVQKNTKWILRWVV